MDERQKIDQMTERVLRYSVPRWRYMERLFMSVFAFVTAMSRGSLVLMTVSVLTMAFALLGGFKTGAVYRVATLVAQGTVGIIFWAIGGLVLSWVAKKVIQELTYDNLFCRAMDILQWAEETFPFSFIPGDRFPLDVLNRLVNTQCVPLIDKDKHKTFVRLVITHLIYRLSLPTSVREELDGWIEDMTYTHQARGIGWPIRIKRFFTTKQSFRMKRLADRYDHFFQEWNASYRSAAPRRIEYAPLPLTIDFEDVAFEADEYKKQKA